MSNEFSKWYLALLRKQVDDEIQFLVKNGHNIDKISIKCPFCIDTKKGYFRCHRLKELRQFQSSIVVESAREGLPKAERKRIGYEDVEKSLNDNFDYELPHTELPLLHPVLTSIKI